MATEIIYTYIIILKENMNAGIDMIEPLASD